MILVLLKKYRKGILSKMNTKKVVKMCVPFNSFIEQLHKNGDLEDYALRVGTSPQYLLTHLKHRRKIPSKQFMQILAQESYGAFSFEDLVLWFYGLKTA